MYMFMYMYMDWSVLTRVAFGKRLKDFDGLPTPANRKTLYMYMYIICTYIHVHTLYMYIHPYRDYKWTYSKKLSDFRCWAKHSPDP